MRIVTMLILLSFCGCAGAQLESDMKDERGYSESDVSAIYKQTEKYKAYLLSAQLRSNRFNNASEIAAKEQLRKVWCNCYKKLGDGCRHPSRGIASVDYPVWLGANAVEMTFASQETSFEIASESTSLDGAFCN